MKDEKKDAKKAPLPSLNARRDAYVATMRALCVRLPRELPADLDGILGRSAALLETQQVNLDRLETLDFEGGSDPNRVFHALVRAEQLPRMVLAMGEVLLQQEKDKALRPIQRDCLNLARELVSLTKTWVLTHQAEIDLSEDLEA